MTGDPLVSIRCMVYNHEPFLRQCLDGFVMQKTTFPFEAVVHDDASTDGSAAIIREYVERYPDIIKPVYETENQYGKGTLGRILSAATHPNTKYVAFCEGDDYWTDPYKLQIQVDFLESHPEYTMCFHQANTILDETGEETDRFPAQNFRSIESRDYDSTELFLKWTVPTASMVVNRKCLYFKLKHFKPSPYGDIYKVLVCANRGKVRGIDRMMSVYRIQTHGITFSSTARERYIMYSPGHFVNIMNNFPKVDKKVIRREISYRYWVRAQHQNKVYKKATDYMMSFKYDFSHALKRLILRFLPERFQK